MGLVTNGRAGGLVTNGRGNGALAAQAGGSALGGATTINVVPAGAATLVNGVLTIDTSGGAAGDVQTAADFTADNALVRVDLPSGGRYVQQSGWTVDDNDTMTNGSASILVSNTGDWNGVGPPFVPILGSNTRNTAAGEVAAGVVGGSFDLVGGAGIGAGVIGQTRGAAENVAFLADCFTGETAYLLAARDNHFVGEAFRVNKGIALPFTERLVMTAASPAPAAGLLGTAGTGEIQAASQADFDALNSQQSAYDGGRRIKMSGVATPLELETVSGATPVANETVLEMFSDQGFPLVWLVDPAGTGSPSCSRNLAGTLGFMRDASNPQILAGAAAATGSFFVDAENNRPILLNNLHTGETVIGVGGLMAENASTDLGRSAGPAGAGVPFRDGLFSRGIGVHGATPPTSAPTVTGSRGGNAALASLLTALASYGLSVDSTTP